MKKLITRLPAGRQGFTFIELLLYMGLLGILIVIMSQMFIAIVNLKLESSSSTAIQQDGTYITSRIAYDVRRASAILSPSLGQTSSVLSLDIVDAGVHHTYQYASNSGVLTLSDGTNADVLEGSGSAVTQFTVTRVGNSATVVNAKDTVDIVLTMTSKYVLSQGPDTMTYRFAVGLR